MTERPTSPDCSMSSSSSLTAESSVTGCRGWSSSVGREPPARDRAWANDCRTALAPRTAESRRRVSPGRRHPPRRHPWRAQRTATRAATQRTPCAGDAPAGPVAQSGAGPVAEPQPALSWSDRPETGLSPASASAARRRTGADAPPPGRRSPDPPAPLERCPGPADSCPAPASPQDGGPHRRHPGPGAGALPAVGRTTRAHPCSAGRGARRGTTPGGGATGACCDTVSTWIPSTMASTPSSSMSAWRTMSAWLPARKVWVRPGRRDAEGQRPAVEGRDLGVLRHEGPRDAAHREDATEDVGPRAPDRIGVHATGRTAAGAGVGRRLPAEATPAPDRGAGRAGRDGGRPRPRTGPGRRHRRGAGHHRATRRRTTGRRPTRPAS